MVYSYAAGIMGVKMKVSTIIITAFVLVGLLSSIGGAYYFYLQSNELLEDQVINNLEGRADLLENSIDRLIKAQGEKLKIAAKQSELTIEELKEIRDTQEEFYELFILDSNGLIIKSSDESQIGKNKSNDAYFTNVTDRIYLKPAYYSATTTKHSIAISFPFKEKTILVARIELDAFDDIIRSSSSSLGETGEVLLTYSDEKGLPVFFTERKFEEEALPAYELAQVILPINATLAGTEAVFFGLDYRGVPVISVTRYLDDIDVGLVVKIDSAEAFGLIQSHLVSTAIILIILISFIVSVFGFFITYLISNPIKKLTTEVNKISKGVLDIQLGKSNIEEIQILIDSLNRILASLKLAILRTGLSKDKLGLGDAVTVKELAEKKLKESEARHKAIYENSSDAIMILDSKGFIDCNPATLKLFKLKSIEEFTKKHPADLSPPKQSDGSPSLKAAGQHIKVAFETGSNHFKWVHRKSNGVDFPADVLLTRLALDGNIVLLATVREDVNLLAKQNKKQRSAK